MNDKLLKVGSYTPETGGKNTVINREYYRQGWIVKDEDAFLNDPKRVCYVPELSDSTYTRQDFLTLCNGQEIFTQECFYAINWQHPETWVDEQYRDDEWGWCSQCNLIYDMEGVVCPCPTCGTGPDEKGEQNGNSESKRRSAKPGGI